MNKTRRRKQRARRREKYLRDWYTSYYLPLAHKMFFSLGPPIQMSEIKSTILSPKLRELLED